MHAKTSSAQTSPNERTARPTSYDRNDSWSIRRPRCASLSVFRATYPITVSRTHEMPVRYTAVETTHSLTEAQIQAVVLRQAFSLLGFDPFSRATYLRPDDMAARGWVSHTVACRCSSWKAR